MRVLILQTTQILFNKYLRRQFMFFFPFSSVIRLSLRVFAVKIIKEISQSTILVSLTYRVAVVSSQRRQFHGDVISNKTIVGGHKQEMITSIGVDTVDLPCRLALAQDRITQLEIVCDFKLCL